MAQIVEKRMAAVLLKGHGGFEQLVFRTDIAVPVPDKGEVLIKVGAAGVNNTDINTRIGTACHHDQQLLLLFATH